ncbi:glycosyltransferase [Vibrio astriarenae]
MKGIVFFINSLGGGGAERVCVTLANEMSSKGVDVTVLTLDDIALTNKKYLHANVKFDSLRVGRSRDSFLRLFLWIKRNKAKELLCFGYEVSIATYIVSKLPGVSFKYTVRNVNTLSVAQKGQGFVYRMLLKKTFLKARLIINQCKSMELDLLSIYPKLEGNSVYIHNPVSEMFRPVGRNENCDIDNYNIICVGRLEEQKNYFDAIKVVSVLESKYNIRVGLRIFGEGSQKEALLSLIDRLNLKDRVRIFPYSSDIRTQYISSHVFLLTSIYEGFPNALLEAISSGIPAVSYDCPSGPNEIINDGTNGYLVPLGDIDDLANKLYLTFSKSWNALELSESMAKFGIAQVNSQYMRVLNLIS